MGAVVTTRDIAASFDNGMEFFSTFGGLLTLEPAPEAADDNYMQESGVLIGTDGPYHNVLKVRPPMPFGDEDADALLESLEQALSVVSSSPAR
jgi:acetylornithine/succinyldiaminopimelate/putrescine aminotransferase